MIKFPFKKHRKDRSYFKRKKAHRNKEKEKKGVKRNRKRYMKIDEFKMQRQKMKKKG